jgi:hypothetical protein
MMASTVDRRSGWRENALDAVNLHSNGFVTLYEELTNPLSHLPVYTFVLVDIVVN